LVFITNGNVLLGTGNDVFTTGNVLLGSGKGLKTGEARNHLKFRLNSNF
jgi:hypothetical protein